MSSLGYYVAGNNSIEIEVLKQECAEWSVQIGCHTDVLSDITNRQRPAVIFLRRSLQPKRLQLCSSYGGLLFLRSPDASGCSITVSLNNVVLTPTYNLADPYRVCAWEQKRKTADGLWADINSLYIAFNMPSSSVLIILANHDLRGTVPIRRDRVVADIQPVVGGMHAGYPIVTMMDVVNPSNRAFMLNIDYLKDKTIEPTPGLRWAMFHELGHNMQRDWWTFNGTREVTNNIFVLHALETICQVRPGFYAWADQQMSKAREYIKNGANFVKWREDPLLGLLIYTQLAQQFGWSNYKAVFRYYENNKPNLTNDQQKIDYWIVTFSQQVKKNLIPLFKFWGFPISASTVKTLSTLPTAVISDEIIQIDPKRYTL
ncbi:unnamed protein product [Adineta ricciae]|uniref:Peptidase M60 domain-containing protein n=1 Tax=Adineta ricciae TaxID=249248 RepID=A0A815I598_ADIRI|nr:unnamed protein product [Adineta ricciae]